MPTLAAAISRDSKSPALIIPGPSPTTITYPHLHHLITTVQTRLASFGLAPHSAVSLALPNTLPFAISFLAISAQRCIAAPLNPAYKQAEFEFYIDDLKSALVLVPRGAVAQDAAAVKAARVFGAGVAEVWWEAGEVRMVLLERGKLGAPQQLVKSEEEDTALVLHTSGTTGRPKAVPLSHRNLTRTMQNIVNTYQLTPQDRTYLVMPLFHVHGLLAAFLAPLASGGTVIIPPKFSAHTFWGDFTRYGATWYTAVPTIHQILLKSPLPSPIPPIRFIRSCSSPLSPSTFHALEEALKAPVLEAYAMTEAAHQMTSNPLPPAKRKPGTVGLGQGVEVSIRDLTEDTAVPHGTEGEICIRGPNVTAGYINNPSANASSFTASGYFRTGDQGKLDEDSYVVITGRIKELINRAGEKISPIEVDNAISSHPAVGEAVSFAMESEMYGQVVGAAVVLKAGKSVGEGELREWVGTRLSKFKVPEKWYFTEIMPKTATGKVQRRIVAEEMAKRDTVKAKL